MANTYIQSPAEIDLSLRSKDKNYIKKLQTQLISKTSIPAPYLHRSIHVDPANMEHDRTAICDMNYDNQRPYKRMLLDLCYTAFMLGWSTRTAGEYPPEKVFRKSDIHHNIMENTHSPSQKLKQLLLRVNDLQEFPHDNK